MGLGINEVAGKMTPLCRKLVHVNMNCGILDRIALIRRFFRFICNRIVLCSKCAKPAPAGLYRRLDRPTSPAPVDEVEVADLLSGYDTDSDSVSLKISLLGDSRIGKTSFVMKYVGDEQERKCLQMKGLNLMDKTLFVSGARIAFSIWDLAGDNDSQDHVPIACKDSVAIFFMFDLTSRCTLNSVIGWYNQARKWNKTAIPILIGTKFDDFVRLPPRCTVDYSNSGQRVCKGDESDIVLLKCKPQHKREQDIQVYNGQALELALDC